MKRLSRKEIRLKSKPWITSGLSKSILIKNSVYKKYIKTKSPYYHAKFKMYRNKLSHLLKISKKQYYSDYFLDCAGDGKKIWKGIRQIVRCKATTGQKFIKIVENEKEISNPIELANKFNHYFANIGTDTTSKIPEVSKDPLQYLNQPVLHSFFVSPTSTKEIETVIGNLKSGKAVGPSSLPVDILKLLKSVVSELLEFIFNASFETGIVPSNFKLANVIPIFKKGSKYCISYYRPISLLSVFNKIIEKLFNRLIKFLKKRDIFFEKQFGFRANHSTEHALLCIIDKIQKAIENRNYSCGIFLDFSKAFDTIDRTILIKKLEYYGIRGVAKKWFISYLSNRRQIVTVNGVQSEENSITCGVPQGSVLGPLLFLIYVNDFDSCSDLFDFHMFADDANLSYESNNIAFLVTTVNNDLGKAYTWLWANKLLLNLDKSNFVIFHPPQRNIPNQIYMLQLTEFV